MKRRKLVWLLVGLLAIMALGGCKEDEIPPTPTLPPPPPPTAVPEPTEVPLTYISKENVGDVSELNTSTLRNEPYISCVEFSPVDDNSIVTWSYDNQIRAWDVNAWEDLNEIPAINGLATAFSPDGLYFAAGIRGFRLFIFNTSDWSIKNEITVNGSPQRVAFIDNENVAMTSAQLSRIEIYNVNQGVVDDQINSPSGVRLAALSISDGGGFLAFGDATGGIFVKNLESRELVLNEKPTNRVVMDVAFSADGSMLAAAHDDGTVVIYDTATWSQTATFMENGSLQSIPHIVFTPETDMVAVAGDSGNLSFWDVSNGEMLRSIALGELAWSLDISPDGSMIVVGMNNGRLSLYGLPQ